jgi:hypothetical protein
MPPVNVFLSRASEDRKYAEDLRVYCANLLRDRLIKIWDFGIEMRAGQDWVDKVAQQLQGNDNIFVALLTGKYILSDPCMAEFDFATNHRDRIHVIPVRTAGFLAPHFEDRIRNDFGLTLYPTTGMSVCRNAPSGWSNVANALTKLVYAIGNGQQPTHAERSAMPKGIHNEEFFFCLEANDRLLMRTRDRELCTPTRSSVVSTSSLLQDQLRELTHLHFSKDRGSGVRRGQVLREIAKLGRQLKKDLFGSQFGTVRAELMRQPTQLLIKVTDERLPHVPWGLLFDGDVDTIRKDVTEEELIRGFWGMKYNVACVFEMSGNPSLLSRPVELTFSNDDILRIFQADAFRSVEPARRKIFQPRRYLTRDELRESIVNASDPFLAYFFGSGTVAQLFVSKHEREIPGLSDNFSVVSNNRNHVERLVLVDIDKAIQNSQWIVPVVIWLQGFYDLYGVFREVVRSGLKLLNC